MMRSPHCPAPDEPGAVAAGRSHWASAPPALFDGAERSLRFAGATSNIFSRLLIDKSGKNPLMNDLHFKNEFYSSIFWRSLFYRDAG
jgi:hypothetical protein